MSKLFFCCADPGEHVKCTIYKETWAIYTKHTQDDDIDWGYAISFLSSFKPAYFSFIFYKLSFNPSFFFSFYNKRQASTSSSSACARASFFLLSSWKFTLFFLLPSCLKHSSYPHRADFLFILITCSHTRFFSPRDVIYSREICVIFFFVARRFMCHEKASFIIINAVFIIKCDTLWEK